uniref:Glycosyl hydrolase family 13 catalytic domain-containing protein n=1 Tax=Panagrolaimus sp. ES5 TaxID=591445 RepID=A0AC34FXT6_9BILA
MSESRRMIERGHKTDSYISAVQGNPVPITLPKTDATQKEAFLLESEQQQNSKPVGLTSEELQYYRDDSFWKTLRRILFILFLLTWVLLFCIAILLITRSPGCDIVEHKWWQGAVVYQIWTPSFKNTDNDSDGDFDGISVKLTQLRQIGVSAIFPRPFISTDESGLGAIHYKSVQESLGGFSQAQKLINEAHKEGLKVIIDIPVVTTSENHEWFQRSSRASRPENAEFSSFYYWKRNVEPSDYVDRYKNSSVFYYHLKQRPDLPILNWRADNVSEAIKEALSFWIDQGIDGFHFGFIEYLARTPDAKSPDWPEIARILRGIRDHVNFYKNGSVKTKEKDIFLMGSSEPLKEDRKRLLQSDAGLDAIVTTELDNIAVSNKICYASENSVAGCTNEIISDLLVFHSSTGVYPVWEFGNPYTDRIASRVHSKIHAELLMMIQLLLPGTSMIYYGDEIGSINVVQMGDKTAEKQRGEMAWDTENGFHSQFHDRASQLRTFQKLAKLRPVSNAIISGETYISKVFQNAFSLTRFELKDSETCGKVYVLVVNFGHQTINHSISDIPPFQAANPSYAQIIAVSSNTESYQERQDIDISTGIIKLGPQEGILFSFKV